MPYAEVAVEAAWGPRNPFSYSIPAQLTLQIGQAVWVPFGPRVARGIVLDLVEIPAVSETREVLSPIDSVPLLSPAQVHLALWMSQRYLAPLFESTALMLPPEFRRKLAPVYSLTAEGEQADSANLSLSLVEVLQFLQNRVAASQTEIERAVGKKTASALMGQLLRRGLVVREWRWERPKVAPKVITYLKLAVEPEEARERARALALTQGTVVARVLEIMANAGGLLEQKRVRAMAKATAEHLESLLQAGLLHREEVRVARDPLGQQTFSVSQPLPLTTHQSRAWEEIAAGLDGSGPKAFLLYGVTGSGKTELYLRALERVVAQGKRGLVLVPEIAMTPQAVERFASRFPQQVAVLHSGLSPGEQFDEWWRIHHGEFAVVIGSRSAIFAPQPDLGLVVLDEEHEWTYKQTDPEPRYHAGEVALKLAELTGSVVISGSATPSVESYYRSLRGEFHLLHLPERIGSSSPAAARETSRGLPEVHLVDLRQELRAGNRSIFSVALQKALAEVLAQGEQAILFLNRRGTSTFVQCRDCGYVLRCSGCEVALTYHSESGTLLCHQCSRRRRVPGSCPDCKSRRIKFLGLGTQRVQEEVAHLFPQARVLRWDRDVTRTKGAHERILHQFSSREADVLVGTQMIAKGLDIPSVTLVGVVSADTGLHLPDFRAGERSFQVLCQVTGRAGRSPVGGQAIIQTYTPEHYAVQAAARQDYESFYRQEIEYRRRLNLPPFTRLARLLFSHTNDHYCQREVTRVAALLQQEIRRQGQAATDVIGPAPAYPPRVRGRFRWHIIVRGPDPELLLEGLSFPSGWAVDIDPISLL